MKLKFRLMGPWACLGQVIDAGQTIEAADDGVLKWNGTVVPVPLPFEAQAQDQASYNQMVAWYDPIYGSNLLNKIHYAKGIVPKTEGT
jgi:hypothetical protein